MRRVLASALGSAAGTTIALSRRHDSVKMDSVKDFRTPNTHSFSMVPEMEKRAYDTEGTEIPNDPMAPYEVDLSDGKVVGDQYGLWTTKAPFYSPINRGKDGTPVEMLVSEPVLERLCGELKVSEDLAREAMVRSQHNMNEAIRWMETTHGVAVPRHSYGLVAMELYEPEAFALVDVSFPTYESLQNEDLLNVVHELTMSAAEMPTDTPRAELLPKFINEWTVESGETVQELAKEYDLQINNVLIMPYGEYSAQGFYVKDPINEGFQNMGSAVTCVVSDLKTGIHNRFRFHCERMCDTVAEHIVHEYLHFAQDVHVLRQPFWFQPTSSVEDYIRQKEQLNQPSAVIFEMRYTTMQRGGFGFRNVIELEKLKMAQHKNGKLYQENQAPSRPFTTSGETVSAVSVAASPGDYSKLAQPHTELSQDESVHKLDMTMMEDLGWMDRTERVWRAYYTNNYY